MVRIYSSGFSSLAFSSLDLTRLHSSLRWNQGNTYSYDYNTWISQIQLAVAGGIDGFALNLGADSSQVNGLDLAYQAAAGSGTGFKMFLSLDMTVFGCSSYGHADILKSLVSKFAGHSNQAKYASKVLVGTFAGSDW